MIDWNGNLEAVLEDGSVVSAKVYRGPDEDGDYLIDYDDETTMYVKPNGKVYGLDVRIRNVAETEKPVRTAADMLERMEDLTRRLADSMVFAKTGLGIDARAIVAEMTPPVDPDIAEVDAILAMDTDEGHKILSAIKRGREMEREDK